MLPDALDAGSSTDDYVCNTENPCSPQRSLGVENRRSPFEPHRQADRVGAKSSALGTISIRLSLFNA